MVGFEAQGGFLKQGMMGVCTYLEDPTSDVLTALSAPTVTAINYTRNELLVGDGGGRFNLTNQTPASQRSIRVCSLGYDAEGALSATAVSSATTVTPLATDNALEVVVEDVSPLTLFVIVFVDEVVANYIPTPWSNRKNKIATTSLTVPVFYEPSAYASSADSVEDVLSSSLPARGFKEFALGLTTGTMSHKMNFTTIDLPMNGMANALITTKSFHDVSFTLAAPKSVVQALTTGGTAFLGCGDASPIIQLGKRYGSTGKNRVFSLVLPGDSPSRSYNALFYANATHADATQEINYDDENASNLPLLIKQAPSSFFTGCHDWNLVSI